MSSKYAEKQSKAGALYSDQNPLDVATDEDELMFIWNKREAPQHRAPKVEEELSRRLAGIADAEEHLRTRRAEARAADAALLATVGVSAQHPLGALAGGQRTSAIAAQEGPATPPVRSITFNPLKA